MALRADSIFKHKNAHSQPNHITPSQSDTNTPEAALLSRDNVGELVDTTKKKSQPVTFS